MSKVFIICGNPKSGKTTFIKNVFDQLGESNSKHLSDIIFYENNISNETENIEKIKASFAYMDEIKTVYIDNFLTKPTNSEVDYSIYDVIIDNNGSLELLNDGATTFIENFINN